MKKLLLLVLLVLLAGCTVNKDVDVYGDLDIALKNLNQSFEVRLNHNTNYYNYYVPSDMQDFDGNTNSNAMTFNNATIVMNLNIASIVNAESFGIKYFIDDGFFNKTYKTYEQEDNFVKNNGEVSKYKITVYEKDNYYLITIITDELIFYCTSDEYDFVDAVEHIFTIASSVETDREKIVADYSKKDVIESVKQQVNLFPFDIPSSGLLNELVIQSDGVVLVDEGNNVQNESDKEEELVEEVDEDIEVEEDNSSLE